MSKRDEWVLNVRATTVLEAARVKQNSLTGDEARQMRFYERWLESVGSHHTVRIDLDDVKYFGLDLETLIAEFPI